MKKLTTWGWILTGLWVLTIGFLFCTNKQSIFDLDLNNLGDFLAGSVAPLAVLWFIIGYFQQGQELRLNTKALNMQYEELVNQVKETRKLVEQTSQQTEIKRKEYLRSKAKDKPRLVYSGHSKTSPTGLYSLHKISFKNAGQPASNFWAKCEKSKNCIVSASDYIDTGEQGSIVLEFKTEPTLPVIVSYGYQYGTGERVEENKTYLDKEGELKNIFIDPFKNP